jgi:copper(I)-binding protein
MGGPGGAFLTIHNNGTEADRLVSAKSPVAGVVEIHEMKMEGGTMRMRAAPDVEIKPGATVELKPGGYHVMLQALKKPLKQGEKVPLTLTFAKSGSIDIMVDVAGMGATAPMGGMSHGH